MTRARRLSCARTMVLALTRASQPAAPPPEPAETAKPADAQPAVTAVRAAVRPSVATQAASVETRKPQARGPIRVGVSGDLLALDPPVSASAYDRRISANVLEQRRAALVQMSPMVPGHVHTPVGLPRFVQK